VTPVRVASAVARLGARGDAARRRTVLYHRQIGTGIEQPPDECASAIVGDAAAK